MARAQTSRSLDGLREDEEEEIAIGEPETDEESEDEPEEGAPAQASPTRSEKKRNRFAEARRAAEDANRERDAEREARIRAEARAAAVETNYQFENERRRREEEATREDPYEKRDKELAEQQQMIIDQFEALQSGGTLTAAKAKELRDKASSIQAQRLDVRVEKKTSSLGNHRDAVTSQNVKGHVTKAFIEANYPDVISDPVALQYAHARHLELVRKENKPDTQETLVEAMEETRSRYAKGGKAPRRPGPSQAARRGATGVPTGGGGGIGTETPKTYTPSKDERKIALAMYQGQDIPEKEKIRRWVNKTKPWEKED